MEATSHTEQALAVARETGWDLDEYAEDRKWSGVALGPVGVHRDSPALDRSNWDTIYPDLVSRFGDAVSDVRFGHWGVGWVEEIASDAGNAEVQAAIAAWREALEDYPVADEEAFCALEYEEALDMIETYRSSSIERDGIRYEVSELLPDDWASQVFGVMFDAGDDTSPDGMRGESIDAAMYELGLYVPETPLVEL